MKKFSLKIYRPSFTMTTIHKLVAIILCSLLIQACSMSGSTIRFDGIKYDETHPDYLVIYGVDNMPKGNASKDYEKIGEIKLRDKKKRRTKLYNELRKKTASIGGHAAIITWEREGGSYYSGRYLSLHADVIRYYGN